MLTFVKNGMDQQSLILSPPQALPHPPTTIPSDFASYNHVYKSKIKNQTLGNQITTTKQLRSENILCFQAFSFSKSLYSTSLLLSMSMKARTQSSHSPEPTVQGKGAGIFRVWMFEPFQYHIPQFFCEKICVS